MNVQFSEFHFAQESTHLHVSPCNNSQQYSEEVTVQYLSSAHLERAELWVGTVDSDQGLYTLRLLTWPQRKKQCKSKNINNLSQLYRAVTLRQRQLPTLRWSVEPSHANQNIRRQSRS